MEHIMAHYLVNDGSDIACHYEADSPAAALQMAIDDIGPRDLNCAFYEVWSGDRTASDPVVQEFPEEVCRAHDGSKRWPEETPISTTFFTWA
jgi:hypothetical protein